MAALSMDACDGGRSAGTERWTVRAGSGPRAVAEWEDVLATTHVAFDVRLPEEVDGTFTGMVERRRIGPLHLVDCVCTPFSGRRSSAVMGGGTGDGSVGLQIVRRGTERVTRAAGQQRVLEAGAVGIWDGARAVGVDVVEPFTKRTLIFPRELVQAVSPRFADVEALPVLGERAGSRLLVR
jgi:AraC family transcriptional activator of tynA and feaB